MQDQVIRVDSASGHTMAKCRKCGEEYDASFFDGKCPHCDEQRYSLDGGYTYGGLMPMPAPKRRKRKKHRSAKLTQESINKRRR